MCTVSFIPLAGSILLAHSRDEKSSRAKAIPPKQYTVNGYTLLFPQDGTAGGTWVACSSNGSAGVLLNGAFEKHVHQPPYRRSRGLVLLDIMSAADPYQCCQQIDVTGVEPFTVVLWANDRLYECRWDGQHKHHAEKDASKPCTWSSVTLYNKTVLAKRKAWFNQWLQLHLSPDVDALMQFHLTAGDGDQQNDLRMNRNNELLTISITAMEISSSQATMTYLDLQDNTTAVQHCIFTKTVHLPL